MNPSASTPPISRLHAVIEGRVQGVGFRYFVIEKALPKNLTGWVRNTRQGAVEVMAEGKLSDLQSFLDDLRAGPSSAFVTQVQQEWLEPTGEFSRFFIASTG